MTLATHAVAGAAIAVAMPTHPIAAFCAGFASHFALDALPHYDYPIFSDGIHPKKSASMQFDAAFWRDACDFSLDAGAGIIVSLIFFAPIVPLTTLWCGALGGMLPDPLQFVSNKLRVEPLDALQRFHQWIHTSHRLRESGRLWLGIVSQLALVAAIIVVIRA